MLHFQSQTYHTTGCPHPKIRDVLISLYTEEEAWKKIVYQENLSTIIWQAIMNVFTCQPTPRLRTEGGIGVALAYLDTAMKTPVDCSTEEKSEYR